MGTVVLILRTLLYNWYEVHVKKSPPKVLPLLQFVSNILMILFISTHIKILFLFCICFM